MKLIIVRHGDPDYSIDSLTNTGWQEAELLSRRMAKIPADAYFVSPLGRAKDTASLTLKALNREAEVCDWLREFPPQIRRPDIPDHNMICWDWLPQDWAEEDCFYSMAHWTEHPAMQTGPVKEQYDYVTASLDALLERYGYRREGRIYRAVEPNRKTLVFFCHFGLECVLLSHLLNIPPMALWHGTCAAPTSVTTLVTEERRQGIAAFRMLSFGDISHLYAAGREPSFAARFCEALDGSDERVD